jgi:hypothetical protein
MTKVSEHHGVTDVDIVVTQQKSAAQSAFDAYCKGIKPETVPSLPKRNANGQDLQDCWKVATLG